MAGDRRVIPVAQSVFCDAWGVRNSFLYAPRLYLSQHDCFAKGGDGIPVLLASYHGLNKCRTREVSVTDHISEDAAVFSPCRAHRSRSDDTRAFLPAQSETGTYRSSHVRYAPVSGGSRGASQATSQRVGLTGWPWPSGKWASPELAAARDLTLTVNLEAL